MGSRRGGDGFPYALLQVLLLVSFHKEAKRLSLREVGEAGQFGLTDCEASRLGNGSGRSTT
jgi:hypothetical protein